MYCASRIDLILLCKAEDLILNTHIQLNKGPFIGKTLVINAAIIHVSIFINNIFLNVVFVSANNISIFAPTLYFLNYFSFIVKTVSSLVSLLSLAIFNGLFCVH